MNDRTTIEIPKSLLPRIKKADIPNQFVNTVKDRVRYLIEVQLDRMESQNASLSLKRPL